MSISERLEIIDNAIKQLKRIYGDSDVLVYLKLLNELD